LVTTRTRICVGDWHASAATSAKTGACNPNLIPRRTPAGYRNTPRLLYPGRVRRGSRLIVVLAACLASHLFTRPAHSDEEPADVEELRARTKEAALAGHHAEAIQGWERLYALTHAPEHLYNVARAYEADHQFAKALTSLDRFAREAPPDLRARVPALDKLVARLTSEVATLRIECETAGAEVRFRNVLVGTTPLDGPVRVEAGDGELRVERAGFFPFVRRVSAAAGATSDFVFALLPRATSGQVTVTSNAPGAQISIDGASLGASPIDVVLPQGTHAFSAVATGFEKTTASHFVTAGTEGFVQLDMPRERPLVSRWWFWASIAAVAVGTGAVIYAVTRERPAESGDLPPGTLGTSVIRF
jgi:hypothetical protein